MTREGAAVRLALYAVARSTGASVETAMDVSNTVWQELRFQTVTDDRTETAIYLIEELIEEKLANL